MPCLQLGTGLQLTEDRHLACCCGSSVITLSILFSDLCAACMWLACGFLGTSGTTPLSCSTISFSRRCCKVRVWSAGCVPVSCLVALHPTSRCFLWTPLSHQMLQGENATGLGLGIWDQRRIAVSTHVSARMSYASVCGCRLSGVDVGAAILSLSPDSTSSGA